MKNRRIVINVREPDEDDVRGPDKAAPLLVLCVAAPIIAVLIITLAFMWISTTN